MLPRVAGTRGVRNRRGVADAVRLVARVDRPVHEKAERARLSLGISMAAYLEMVLEREQVDEQGRPVWAVRSHTDTQEQAVKSA